ncbi:sugar phosphate isomerase/epimerase family protein [Acuticoccus mangrovi]|uniref:Sugar phosphate isomerase/epimerase n=1 Tax=Acuticoccus mangrovi TaxID=2796142 RepID=A0A934MKX5_9HYPH|nr:sugar phosphate isomerase/epimerase family protein [Acuticoccus mangrovi]MBJ3775829.1 sugar phosphate isomerase/epimerase [Acuticoccus mangrovi]
MKLSLCNEVLRDLPFDRQCAFAAAVGFQGLELAPFTLAQNPETLTEAGARAARRALAAEGLECAGLHWLLAAPDGLSITSADAAVRGRTVDLMRRLVAFAAEAGARVMVHGSPRQRELAPGAEAEGRARAVDAFALAGEAAAAAGVVYAIEPLARRETAFVNTVAEAVAIVKEVASPGLATMIDTCATAFDGGDPAALVAEWLPTGHIAHIHVNDPNRRGPGEGALAFAPTLAALKALDYRGWVSAEPFIYEPDGPATAARAAGYLDGILEALS